MPGTLTHAPADILRWVLIDLGYGTDPDDGVAWPIFSPTEPPLPDSVVTIRTTQGIDSGRTMIDGEKQEFDGVQLRIRAPTEEVGYQKARELYVALNGVIYDEQITLDSTTYRLHSVSTVGGVIPLGKEAPTSKRSIFTINALVSVRETN